ncbi:amidase [Aneurinibacillus sp. Ricciae_BoGa-3]|uniref:amidase n=1 Tax=Aneurinibacillus sp. Ricciae_BoGa-3 TaxID=3022697 RepID=UPI0023425F94|nr:amidase [Aneurinibacillus sp. Ricciae_BoGa-3]WCK54488.1 amidase [Aneurinibacillus sp. Ricciae_BoGa-3]
MTTSDIVRMDLHTLSQHIEEKKLSPVEVVQALLERIEQLNPTLNAVITVCDGEALEAAKQAEEEISRGNYKGPLHGVPIGLKDLIFTRGVRTTMGSEIYKDFVPEIDATVVQKLKEAGAIIIGKLNTHEFAYGPTGDISYFGAVRNPYDTTRITGGSSSGSGASVAAGLAFGALGTDTGGSIRIPSSACGIVGMKPTFGRVSKHGVYPLAFTLDHVGPMTRTVYDNALLLNVLAGFDAQDDYSVQRDTEDFTRLIGESIKGKVVGIPTNFYYDQLQPEVRSAVENSFEIFRDLGATIEHVEIQNLNQISLAQLKTIQSEAYAIHQHHVKDCPDKFHPQVLERLEASFTARGYEYVEAQQVRRQILNSFKEAFERVDVLLTPTLPILPTKIDEREVEIEGQTAPVPASLLRLTGPTNTTGLPSLSLPCGYSSEGLPMGIQLIGPSFAEALLYQFGSAFERAVNFKGFLDKNLSVTPL